MGSSHERRPMRNKKTRSQILIGCHEVSCTARGLFLFPVGPLVTTVIVSCACPSSSASFFPSPGPAPRHRFRVPDCTFRSVHPPPSAPSRAPAITALHSRANSESQPCRLDRMDLPTTSGADLPHFGRSADVILTVFVVVVGYEEVR